MLVSKVEVQEKHGTATQACYGQEEGSQRCIDQGFDENVRVAVEEVVDDRHCLTR